MNIDPTGHSWWSDFWSGVKARATYAWEEVKSFFENTFGFALIVDGSIVTESKYYFAYGYENGVGFEETEKINKPIMFSINIPTKKWRFWEYTARLDINVGKNSFGIGIGGKNSIGFRKDNFEMEGYFNMLGRVGMEIKHHDEDGYVFTRGHINMIEIVFAFVFAYYAPQGLSALAMAFA
ncbi:MAG: hypothetical protein E7382_05215 [Clostridiales bacterium]|nr:hypothetical protein [Clostridiales bacterium]